MVYEYNLQKWDYKAKIFVDITDYNYTKFEYVIRGLKILPKGKRKWISIGEQIRDSYEYRDTHASQRSAYVEEKFLEYVTRQDICDAVDYAYMQIKPEYDNITFKVY